LASRRDQNDFLLGWYQPDAEKRAFKDKLLPSARQKFAELGLIDAGDVPPPLTRADQNRERLARLNAARERKNERRKRRSAI